MKEGDTPLVLTLDCYTTVSLSLVWQIRSGGLQCPGKETIDRTWQASTPTGPGLTTQLTYSYMRSSRMLIDIEDLRTEYMYLSLTIHWNLLPDKMPHKSTRALLPIFERRKERTLSCAN